MSAPDPIKNRLTVPVAICTMLAWLSSLGYAVVDGHFEPLTITTPVMLLLAGYTFGISITRGEKKSDDE